VAVADSTWAVVAYQPIGMLKTGTDYQLNFSAKGENRPGVISMIIKEGSAAGANTPIRVDGQVQDVHLVNLTTSMMSNTLNFRLVREEDLESAVLLFVFAQENEVIIDDVSLRSIEQLQ